MFEVVRFMHTHALNSFNGCVQNKCIISPSGNEYLDTEGEFFVIVVFALYNIYLKILLFSVKYYWTLYLW